MSYLTYNGKYLKFNGKILTIIADSIEADAILLSFNSDGNPMTTDIITITSSGTWTVSKIDTGDGIGWLTAVPSSGGNEDTCTVTVGGSYEGLGRGCILRFTVGTATDDVEISQMGYA